MITKSDGKKNNAETYLVLTLMQFGYGTNYKTWIINANNRTDAEGRAEAAARNQSYIEHRYPKSTHCTIQACFKIDHLIPVIETLLGLNADDKKIIGEVLRAVDLRSK